MSTVGESSGEFVRSLARGLAVIECFGDEHQELTLSEVAKRSAISRATARRLLLTLVQLNYAQFDGTRYSLLPRVLRLGYSYIASQPQWVAVRPFLQQLSGRTGEPTSIAVLDGVEIIYVAREKPVRLVGDALFVGARLPAHLTAMGRVLLSALPEAELDAFLENLLRADRRTEESPDDGRRGKALQLDDLDHIREKIIAARQTGVAQNDEEMELGLRSIAVPIRDTTGATIAAINISTVASNLAINDVQSRYLAMLREARDLVEDALHRRA